MIMFDSYIIMLVHRDQGLVDDLKYAYTLTSLQMHSIRLGHTLPSSRLSIADDVSNDGN